METDRTPPPDEPSTPREPDPLEEPLEPAVPPPGEGDDSPEPSREGSPRPE